MSVNLVLYNSQNSAEGFAMIETQATPREPGVSDTGDTIRVSNLVKTYGSLRAVDDLSFSVRSGEIFALLGPNGAGKTTTVEILEGYRDATSGEVRVLGFNPRTQGTAMKEHIGLMLQQTAMYELVKVGEVVRLFASYYQHPRSFDEMIELVGLQSHRNSFYKNLSGGQKQRLSLALALVGNPEVVFLDEPTGSMDPQMRLQTWDIIKDMRNSGVTVLLTTHYMEEAQRLADTVAIMDHGKLLVMGTPEQLTAGSGSEVVTFNAPPRLTDLAELPDASSIQEERAGVYSVTTSDALSFSAALARYRDDHDIPIENLRVAGASLEDIFLRLTGEEVRE
ncbi:MAG: ABC transporter ATP-binding protein [Chloroflexota bacterium]